MKYELHFKNANGETVFIVEIGQWVTDAKIPIPADVVEVEVVRK